MDMHACISMHGYLCMDSQLAQGLEAGTRPRMLEAGIGTSAAARSRHRSKTTAKKRPDLQLYSTVCTILYSTVQYCAVLYDTVLYRTILYSAVRYGTILYSSVY